MHKKNWHWKCPNCNAEWQTTRPIKNGGNGGYFCRNCYLREKLANMLAKNKIHFYDIQAVNGKRNIPAPPELIAALNKVAYDHKGDIDMKNRELVITIDAISVAITVQQCVINKVSGIDSFGVAPIMSKDS